MTEKIVIIQPTFCPTEQMFQFNKKSIESFKHFLDMQKDLDLEILFGGFADDEFMPKIIQVYKDNFCGICKFFNFRGNYGKAYVVNSIAKAYLDKYPDTKYLFTFDSDMVFNCVDQNLNMFQRLIQLSNQKINNNPIGILAPNMTGDNAHWVKRFENRISVGDEILSWPTSGIGIGGGCLFIKTELWKKINGYKVMGVYAPDDAVLMRDSLQAGYSNAVVETLTIHHPGTQDDKIYQGWKEATSKMRMDYGASLEYTKMFWEKKKFYETNH